MTNWINTFAGIGVGFIGGISIVILLLLLRIFLAWLLDDIIYFRLFDNISNLSRRIALEVYKTEKKKERKK